MNDYVCDQIPRNYKLEK